MPPRSKIAQLPEEIRSWLHKTLVERAFGDIVGVTAELQDMLREAGVAMYIGKSAVGAESQKVQRAQEAIRATTEATKLIAQASSDQTDSRSEAAMALVQSEVFEMLLQLREASDEADPVVRLKQMASVAKSVSMLSRARVNQAKWRDEVDAKVKAAADKASKLAAKGGASAKTVAEIKRMVLGIVERPSTAPPP